MTWEQLLERLHTQSLRRWALGGGGVPSGIYKAIKSDRRFAVGVCWHITALQVYML